ncbi:MAG: hypothetical protein HY262_03220 [Chloroflexi bacterium]|nr:hypothetical protein [Chloroflexota bacterium]
MVVPLIVATYETYPTRPNGDPWNYLAAAERLNAGHPLYALSPGDRPVELHPPYWSVPLLSPPFIAVVWRPLAPFGEAAMLAWWIGGIAATSLYVIWLLRSLENPWSVIALVALSPPIVYGALSGNAIAYLLPLLALRHPATVAAAAAVRLTPILLAPSIGVRATLACGAGIAMVSLAGAGIGNHVDWIQAVTASAPTPLSIAAVTGLPPSVVAAGCLVVALRGWRWAVVAMTLASPTTYLYTFGFLSLALPPGNHSGTSIGGIRSRWYRVSTPVPDAGK